MEGSVMAENETLDLGGAYANRWDAPFDWRATEKNGSPSPHMLNGMATHGRSGSPRNNRKSDRSKE